MHNGFIASRKRMIWDRFLLRRMLMGKRSYDPGSGMQLICQNCIEPDSESQTCVGPRSIETGRVSRLCLPLHCMLVPRRDKMRRRRMIPAAFFVGIVIPSQGFHGNEMNALVMFGLARSLAELMVL